MSDHGNYFEKVEIENNVLGSVLLKYKNLGYFDEVVDILTYAGDYLLIMDQIDEKKYTFSYFRKREVREDRDIVVPKNLYEVLPETLRIISQIVLLNVRTFSDLKRELYESRDEIVKSYSHVRWQKNTSEAEIGYHESTVELYSYDSNTGSSYTKTMEWEEQDSYQNEEATANAFIDQSVALKKNLYRAEASENIFNAQFIDNSTKEYIYKRDIQETLIYLESQEGKKYLEEAAASYREFLRQQLKNHGGNDCPIDYLEFSVRTNNCLHRYGITTVGDIRKMSQSELKKIRNLGLKSFYEVLYKLSDYGIELVE